MIFFAAFLVAKRDLFTSAGRTVLGIEFPGRGIWLRCWSPGRYRSVYWCWRRTSVRSLLFFGIVLVLIYTATERVSWLVIGLGILSRRRAARLHCSSATCRPGSRRG